MICFCASKLQASFHKLSFYIAGVGAEWKADSAGPGVWGGRSLWQRRGGEDQAGVQSHHEEAREVQHCQRVQQGAPEDSQGAFSIWTKKCVQVFNFPGGPGGGVLPQHAAEAAAEHNPEDEVVEEVEGGGELGHLVVDAREDPSTSQSSGRGYSQVVSVSEFHVNA